MTQTVQIEGTTMDALIERLADLTRPRLLVKVSTAAKMLDTSTDVIRNLIRDGRLTRVQVDGKHWHVRAKDVERLSEEGL